MAIRLQNPPDLSQPGLQPLTYQMLGFIASNNTRLCLFESEMMHMVCKVRYYDFWLVHQAKDYLLGIVIIVSLACPSAWSNDPYSGGYYVGGFKSRFIKHFWCSLKISWQCLVQFSVDDVLLPNNIYKTDGSTFLFFQSQMKTIGCSLINSFWMTASSGLVKILNKWNHFVDKTSVVMFLISCYVYAKNIFVFHSVHRIDWGHLGNVCRPSVFRIPSGHCPDQSATEGKTCTHHCYPLIIHRVQGAFISNNQQLRSQISIIDALVCVKG